MALAHPWAAGDQCRVREAGKYNYLKGAEDTDCVSLHGQQGVEREISHT